MVRRLAAGVIAIVLLGGGAGAQAEQPLRSAPFHAAAIVPRAPLRPAAAAVIELYVLRARVVAPPTVRARAGILLDLDTGAILWERSPHARRPEASLTKVMTALVALQHLGLDDTVTVPASITALPWDSTLMGLRPGERVTVRELLYGLFLNSGNDAAVTLAQASGSQTAFVSELNAMAASLGMLDSHFVNPVGLDSPNHYTSAADLALAAQALLSRHPQAAAIASTRDVILPATAGHPAFALHNLNVLLRRDPDVTGLKTGWTGQAGGCLIVTAQRDGHHLLAVLLGSPDAFADGQALVAYGLDLQS
jgi:D-alanyl-D-alanine carboxypeptidase (penicillin-binding protein 5/6)